MLSCRQLREEKQKMNKIANQIKKVFQSQLTIPIVALLSLVIFNLFRDPSFFSITIKSNNLGNTVLSGNLVSILNGASELVILSIGMTLVTSATRGQDISIGAAAAIAGSVFVKVLRAGTINPGTIFAALILACIVQYSTSNRRRFFQYLKRDFCTNQKILHLKNLNTYKEHPESPSIFDMNHKIYQCF